MGSCDHARFSPKHAVPPTIGREAGPWPPAGLPLHDPGRRLVEVDVDTTAYDQGHIPGVVGWNWQAQLCDQVRRDILTKEPFERLMSASGISPTTTLVCYGDNYDWFATYALWQCRYWGHPEDQLQLLNGGRAKWIAEGRALVPGRPSYPSTSYRAAFPDDNVRATRATKDIVFQTMLDRKQHNLVDMRSPDEFSGKVIAPPGMSETAQRCGHIPGAANIPWAQTVNEDSTFKPADALRVLYESKGVALGKDTIAYCRIGERSSHTWFVLKYLLGVPKVRNYDGSWTEWGNLVGAPMVRPCMRRAGTKISC
jgi:thiosulfate/3-mercaptopyruvate sulfurtransferase